MTTCFRALPVSEAVAIMELVDSNKEGKLFNKILIRMAIVLLIENSRIAVSINLINIVNPHNFCVLTILL